MSLASRRFSWGFPARFSDPTHSAASWAAPSAGWNLLAFTVLQHGQAFSRAESNRMGRWGSSRYNIVPAVFCSFLVPVLDAQLHYVLGLAGAAAAVALGHPYVAMRGRVADVFQLRARVRRFTDRARTAVHVAHGVRDAAFVCNLAPPAAILLASPRNVTKLADHNRSLRRQHVAAQMRVRR